MKRHMIRTWSLSTGVRMDVTDRPTEPMRPLDEYTEKVLSSRARGAPYPYELAPLLAGWGGLSGVFTMTCSLAHFPASCFWRPCSPRASTR